MTDRTLLDLARTAFKEHGDIENTKAAVMRMLDDDPELKASILDAAVERAVAEAVYDVRHAIGRRLKKGPPPPGKAARDPSMAAWSSLKISETLLDWSLPNGRSLGDQYGRDLPPLIADFRKIGIGSLQNAALLEAVAKKTPNNKKVRTCVTPEEAQTLLENIRKQIRQEVA